VTEGEEGREAAAFPVPSACLAGASGCNSALAHAFLCHLPQFFDWLAIMKNADFERRSLEKTCDIERQRHDNFVSLS